MKKRELFAGILLMTLILMVCGIKGCSPQTDLVCGDGICNHSVGEEGWTCEVDCCPAGSCGDGICQKQTKTCMNYEETAENCPNDCGKGCATDADCLQGYKCVESVATGLNECWKQEVISMNTSCTDYKDCYPEGMIVLPQTYFCENSTCVYRSPQPGAI